MRCAAGAPTPATKNNNNQEEELNAEDEEQGQPAQETHRSHRSSALGSAPSISTPQDRYIAAQPQAQSRRATLMRYGDARVHGSKERSNAQICPYNISDGFNEKNFIAATAVPRAAEVFDSMPARDRPHDCFGVDVRKEVEPMPA
jgi:hypothetical protein